MRIATLLGVGVLLAGCSGDIESNRPDELDLSAYVTDYVKQCIPYTSLNICPSRVPNCQAAVNTCITHGEHSAKLSRTYFNLDYAERMEEVCATHLQCRLDFQKKIYDKRFAELTHKFTSE